MRCHNERPKSSKVIISRNPTTDTPLTSQLKERLPANQTSVKMDMSNQDPLSFALICCKANSVLALLGCLGSGAIFQRPISMPNTSKPALVPSHVMSEAQMPHRANVKKGGKPAAAEPVSMMLSTMQIRVSVPAHHQSNMGMFRANMTSKQMEPTGEKTRATPMGCCILTSACKWDKKIEKWWIELAKATWFDALIGLVVRHFCNEMVSKLSRLASLEFQAPATPAPLAASITTWVFICQHQKVKKLSSE